jgi:hypothetical protein
MHNGRVLERAGADRFFKGPGSHEAGAFIQGELL